MPSAIIQVEYINPPAAGKKMGSVKAADGTYYGITPAMLGLFQKGSMYDIFFEDREWQGKTYHTVKNVKPATNAAPVHMPAAGAVVSQAAQAREASIEKMAKHKWVGERLDAFIAQGKLSLAFTDLVEAGRLIAEVHDVIFAPKSQKEAHPQSAAEMDDEIPY